MATFTYIDKIELSAGASSIQFTSIPQTYQHLYLISAGRSNVGGQGDAWLMTINGSTSVTSGNRFGAYYDPASATLTGDGGGNIYLTSGNDWTAETYGSAWFLIPNYTTTQTKTIIGRSMWGGPNPTSGRGFLVFAAGAQPANTAAITSLGFSNPDSGGTQMMTGSTFYLYGLS